jgi:hypothetical protein
VLYLETASSPVLGRDGYEGKRERVACSNLYKDSEYYVYLMDGGGEAACE